MQHDLTATAASNEAARAAAAASAVSADASGRLAEFRELVETSSFSTNVSADKVLEFDRADEILDARRFHVQQAGGDSVVGLAAFATAQRDGLARREAFEDLWDHGRRLLYGAVNAGGMGTEGRFGPFCLTIDDPQAPAPDALAVFPDDSVERYTTDAGAVDGDLARDEATAWSRRADLAVTERGDEALAAATVADWPAVVCRPDRYLEVARAGSWPVAALSQVRLRSSYRAELAALRLRSLAGEVLVPDELNQAGAYDVVSDWRRSKGVELMDVP